MIAKLRNLSLWLRLYITACTLVTLVIFCVALRIITVSIDTHLQREMDSALEKHRMLSDALTLYTGTLSEKLGHSLLPESGLLADAAQNYARYYTEDGSYITMTDAHKAVLYNNMPAAYRQAMRLEPPEDLRRSYVLRKIGPETLLFVTGWMELGNHRLRLEYSQDITPLIDSQKELGVRISLWLSSGLLILAGGLYALIKRELRPLSQLGEQARSIAAGDVTKRITIRERDEIGTLARDFNHMADAVQIRTELLERAVQDRETFIASLAHELKTPLTAIMGYTSLLQNYHLNEADREHALAQIYNESRRLDDMTKKLLDLFRLGHGDYLQKQSVSVADLLEQLESVVAFALSRKEQTLNRTVSVPEVTVDPGLMLLLLSNLIENASKASPFGAAIAVHVEAEGEDIVFYVKDTGRGIAEEDLNRVFQPFFTADPARDRHTGGHGLGLSLCKAIAEAHGGAMKIESRVGAGTMVVLRIPGAPSQSFADS